MTKRLLIAFAFLFTAFSASCLSVNYIVNEIDITLLEIETTEDVFGCSEKILEEWEKNRNTFSLFLKHTDADTIERFYFELEDALELRDEERTELLLSRLGAYLRVTAEGEKLKTENIF